MPVKTVQIQVTALTDRANRDMAATSAYFEKLRSANPVELRVKFDRLQAIAEARILAKEMSQTVRDTVKLDVDRSGLGGIPGLGRLFRGGTGPGAGLPGILGGIPTAGSASPVAVIGAVAAGLAALPFLAQAAAGAITLALGGGLAALGVAGALGTGKTISPGAVTAAQDALKAAQLRQIAAQDKLNQLMASGKTTATQLAAAQAAVASSSGAVATAQDRLNKLLNAQQTPAQLAMRKAFANLSNDAQTSLAQIGKSFAPVLLSIAKTADSVLGVMTPVLAGAVAVIAGPVKLIGDTLLRSFASPQVATAVKTLGAAFAGLLRAFAPAIPGIVTSIADGFTNLFRAVGKNPKAFADMAVAVFHLIGVLLDVLAWLTQVADYLEVHFIPAWQRTLKFFEQWGHDIKHNFDVTTSFIIHIWNVTWNNTISRLMRGIHDADALFGGWWHDIAHWYDVADHDTAAAWNTIWNNTIARISRGVGDAVAWFKGLPGKVLAALATLGTDLFNLGKAALSMLLKGIQAGVSPVTSFLSGFAHGIVGIFKKIWGWFSPSSVMYQGGRALMEGLAGGIRDHAHLAQKAAQRAAHGVIPPGGAVSGTVAQWISSALSIAGMPGSWLGGMGVLVRAESGGNPLAVNPQTAGTSGEHAEGIAQTIPSTFMAWALPGHWNIFNPVDDLIASVRYIRATYGSPYNIPGLGTSAYQGYRLGGLITEPILGVGPSGTMYGFHAGETVKPGGGGGRTDALLSDLIDAVDNVAGMIGALTGVTAQAPAVMGAAMAGNARSAVHGALYP